MIRDCECGKKNKDLRALFSSGEIDFRECPKCGLVFRNIFPTTKELDEIYGSAYDFDNVVKGKTDQESPEFTLERYSQFIQNKFKVLNKSSTKLLDYGAGAGGLVKKLRKAGLNADGLEFSKDAREACLEQKGIELISSLKKVPDNYYDVVTMIEVIEHLTQMQDTLTEIKRILVPGGQLFITTPNRHGLRALMERGVWREARKKYHLFLFDSRSLRYHLKLAGFSKINQKIFGPVQKRGVLSYIYSRITQFCFLGGTLYFYAKKNT